MNQRLNGEHNYQTYIQAIISSMLSCLESNPLESALSGEAKEDSDDQSRDRQE